MCTVATYLIIVDSFGVNLVIVPEGTVSGSPEGVEGTESLEGARQSGGP